IVVGVIPLVVPNGSIEAKGFPKFDLVAIARLLGAQHRRNSLDRLPRIAPLALHSRLIDWINVRNADRKSTRLNLQSLMRISYAVFGLKKKTKHNNSYSYD